MNCLDCIWGNHVSSVHLFCHSISIILYNIPVKFWKYDVCDGVNEQKKLELGASIVWLVVQLIFYMVGGETYRNCGPSEASGTNCGVKWIPAPPLWTSNGFGKDRVLGRVRVRVDILPPPIWHKLHSLLAGCLARGSSMQAPPICSAVSSVSSEGPNVWM